MIDSSSAAVDRFNAMSPPDAVRALLACCSARRWAETLAAARPFAGAEDLLATSDRIIANLAPADLDEALAGHPRIGERTELDARAAAEQSGTRTADADVRAALVRGNRDYEARFGHVYLVRAAGRSARELLDDLTQRLHNDPGTEDTVTRRELAAITRLRLSAMLDDLAGSGDHQP